jgi:hypothetical protein
MSFGKVSITLRGRAEADATNLLQGLIVYKVGSVLGNVELPLLDVLAELPVRRQGLLIQVDGSLQKHFENLGSHGEA